jgi:hypothetical protein
MGRRGNRDSGKIGQRDKMSPARLPSSGKVNEGRNAVVFMRFFIGFKIKTLCFTTPPCGMVEGGFKRFFKKTRVIKSIML